MEKKNKRMLLIVGVLLLLGGVTFAYFVGSSMFGGTGSSVEGITANINGAELKIEGNLEFNDLDILPGHKNVSSIKVTATGNNELIPYNLIWKGTNSLNTPLEFKVYKTSNDIETSATCEKKTKVENGAQILNEECTITNEDKLGSIISSGTINKSEEETKEILVNEEFITATSDGMSVYYYIILEYPNLDEDQNNDMGGTFQGTVTVEESNAKPDINILAVKIEQDDGTYQDTTDIPQEGYMLNKSKSTCSNDAIPDYNEITKKFTANNLTKKGTNCYLYFDTYPALKVLTNLGIIANDGTPDFSQIATTDEGVFKAKDESGNDSYYFRGAVTNNYVKFGKYSLDIPDVYYGFYSSTNNSFNEYNTLSECQSASSYNVNCTKISKAGKDMYWRIIRINGDGSIRLIYDGTSAHANGEITVDSIAVYHQQYNSKDNNNMYVGFKYTNGQAQGTETKSNALEQLEAWYENNLKENYADYLDVNAGFCGDRRRSTIDGGVPSGTGGAGTTETFYATYYRVYKNKIPELSCENVDFYTVNGASRGNKSLIYPIGLITADEVAMAGGGWKLNQNYYLYNGLCYWTMSPFNFSGVYANMLMESSGRFSSIGVSNGEDIRPVINLKANTIFTGTGTKTDPYVVN